MAQQPEAEVVDEQQSGFTVSLSNFDGPFDLLLSLIAKHDMDITDVALSVITTEFIAYLGALDSDADLDQASEFLVVAATLLDLKVAGLLPQGARGCRGRRASRGARPALCPAAAVPRLQAGRPVVSDSA